MNAKDVVFADDFSVAGSWNSIEDYQDKLIAIDPKYSFEILSDSKWRKNWWRRKTYLLIQERILQLKGKDTSVQLSNTRLSIEYCYKYVKDLVKDWDNQLTILSTIAETQPQGAYLAFASEFKSKLNYFLRTIPNIRHLLLLLERTIRNKFIPAVTECHICRVTRKEF